MPYETAVACVHVATVVEHATGLGLIEAVTDLRTGAEALAKHPALAGFTDPDVCRIWSSATALPPVAALAADVTDAEGRPDGYRLGDLYQALSVEANKGRALCQTPRFVTELLLSTTLPHAIDEWGLDAIRMVDPACGTGHILVETLIALYAQMGGRHDPRPFASDRTGRALAAIHGIDLDPYVALLARYRLLALACRMGGGRYTLADAPPHWAPQVVCTNSLLDRAEPLLARGQYHLVIGNPPYITVKDKATNEAVRAAYPQVCHRKYSLGLPFFQLMTDLAIPGGWVAQLTANSFMKREFGKPFIEKYLPTLDLRWVIDTSGAYIPGHGTPTVILVHRNQPPASDTVHMVLGKRGEPSQPADPAKGLVWTAIAEAVQRVESNDRFGHAARAAAPEQPTTVVPITASAPKTYTQPTLFDLIAA